MDSEEGVTSDARVPLECAVVLLERQRKAKKLHTAGQMPLFCNFDQPWRNLRRTVAKKSCLTDSSF